MANERDIKIGIKTTADTSGAKEAEEAIKRVGDATQEAAEVNPMLRGKAEYDARVAAEREAAQAIEAQAAAMKKAADAAAELEAGLGKIEEELKGVAEAGEEASDKGGELDENVKSISRAQKAQALAQLAQAVGQIGGKFKEAAAEVEEFDKEAADSMRQTADRIEGVTSAITSLALGFAVGGPVGAGLAAAGLGIAALVNAFQEAEVAAIKAAAGEKKALEESADAARDAAAEAKQRAAALSSQEIENAIKAQNDELAKGLELIEKQIDAERRRRQEKEDILKSEDKLKLAQIDEAEAKGEITPEQARTQRAEVEQGAVQRQREEKKQRALEEAEAARQTRDKLRKESDEARGKTTPLAKERDKAQGAVESAESDLDKIRKQNILIAGLEKDLQEIRNNPAASEEQNREAEGKVARAKNPVLNGTGGTTVDEATKIVAAAKAELERIQKIKKIAEDSAAEISAKARDATIDAAEKEQVAAGTVATVDTIATNEDATTATKQRADTVRRENEAKKKKDEEEKEAKRKALQEEERVAREKLKETADANELRIIQSDNADGGGRSKTKQPRREKGESALPSGGGGNNALRSLANDIGGADTTAEIAMVREAVKAKSAELGGAVVAAMMEMISKQEQLVLSVNQIRERIKRLEGK